MGSAPAAPAMYCNSCGTANSPSNPSCLHCGRPFPELQRQVVVPTGPFGFEGWLILFSFGTCLLAPAWFVNAFLLPTFQPSLIMFASAVPMFLGIAAGVLLATERNQAIFVLRLFFVTLAAKSAIWFAMAAVEPGDKWPYLRVAIRTVLYTIVWGLYFQNSARVRNTYGRNL